MTNLTPAERFSVMERRLAEGAKRLTLTEAAATTGLSIDEAEAALRELLMRYDCVLQVTENGDLIYDFGPRLHRRDEKSFREYLDEFLELLWKGFVLFFKAWIAITLVVYFLIFLTILVMAVIALLFAGGNKSKGRRSRSAAPFHLIYYAARLFVAIFDWGTAATTTTYQTDQHGYRYATYQPKSAPLSPFQPKNAQTAQPAKKSFIASVYDFVFGPPRVTRDPLENQKEIAAYVRRNKGILFVSEIKALTGLDSTPAALLFSDCIGRFQGDIRISDRKLMYGLFDRLLRTAGEDEGRIVYYWDEYEPPHFLTGNTPQMNVLIVFLNGFNLLFSLIILSGAFEEALSVFWLGTVPLLFFRSSFCRAPAAPAGGTVAGGAPQRRKPTPQGHARHLSQPRPGANAGTGAAYCQSAQRARTTLKKDRRRHPGAAGARPARRDTHRCPRAGAL